MTELKPQKLRFQVLTKTSNEVHADNKAARIRIKILGKEYTLDNPKNDFERGQIDVFHFDADPEVKRCQLHGSQIELINVDYKYTGKGWKCDKLEVSFNVGNGLWNKLGEVSPGWLDEKFPSNSTHKGKFIFVAVDRYRPPWCDWNIDDKNKIVTFAANDVSYNSVKNSAIIPTLIEFLSQGYSIVAELSENVENLKFEDYSDLINWYLTFEKAGEDITKSKY